MFSSGGGSNARGINAGVGPLSLELESLDIQDAGIDVVVSEDGKMNLIEFMAAMAEKSKAGTGEAAVDEVAKCCRFPWPQ